VKILRLALPILLAMPAAAQDYPKRCDRCEDLPSLMQELKEQEWLRDKFYQYSPWEKGYQLSASDVEDLQAKVKHAFNAWQKAPSGGGGGEGEPTMGTHPDDCRLVFYVQDAEGKTSTQPYDEAKMKARYCPAVLAFMLAHEASHQRTCRALGKKNKAFLSRPEFVAADEVKAYEEGIRVLEKAINDLAARCKEEGTTATYRLDRNQKITPAKVYESEEKAKKIAEAMERAQREADARKAAEKGRK
jgi:hypothetical protein